jgi:hypothetical protein
VFSDLTRREMKGLLQYLFANIDLNLTTPEKATIHTNNLYLAELHLPPKKAVLDYIDKGCRKPPREAHVILIRRGIKQPDVREIPQLAVVVLDATPFCFRELIYFERE